MKIKMLVDKNAYFDPSPVMRELKAGQVVPDCPDAMALIWIGRGQAERADGVKEAVEAKQAAPVAQNKALPAGPDNKAGKKPAVKRGRK